MHVLNNRGLKTDPCGIPTTISNKRQLPGILRRLGHVESGVS